MFGRFFAFEMGCPDEDATPGNKSVVYDAEPGAWGDVVGQDQVMTLEEIQAQMQQDQDQGQDRAMICECRGLGCKKCKRKKAQVITLTGNPGIPIPIMNMPMGPMSPMGLGGPSMIMMGRPRFF